MNSEHQHLEMHEHCKEQFREINKRLDEGDKLFIKHTTEIAVLQTNVDSLVKSLNGLTKALWGVCGTILTVLFGFVVWYIQNI